MIRSKDPTNRQMICFRVLILGIDDPIWRCDPETNDWISKSDQETNDQIWILDLDANYEI